MPVPLLIETQTIRSKKPKASLDRLCENVNDMINEKVSSLSHRKRIFRSFMCVLNKLIIEYGYKPKKIEMQLPVVGALVVVTHFNTLKFTWHYNW
jgi:hypothetical protein